jgi:hypothetical protein
MIQKSDELIDDLSFMTLNHLYKSQSVLVETNSINVNLNKNFASLLNNQMNLQDSSQIKLDSTFCNLLGLNSPAECSNNVISKRVKF